MAITREEIKGTKILNEVESSNIVRTEYDTQTKEMIVEFKKGGTRYVYEGVPHNTYTKFRMAESQGKFFTTEISKKFEFKKLG
jgi:predicted Ser/Thr protein kinase